MKFKITKWIAYTVVAITAIVAFIALVGMIVALFLVAIHEWNTMWPMLLVIGWIILMMWSFERIGK